VVIPLAPEQYGRLGRPEPLFVAHRIFWEITDIEIALLAEAEPATQRLFPSSYFAPDLLRRDGILSADATVVSACSLNCLRSGKAWHGNTHLDSLRSGQFAIARDSRRTFSCCGLLGDRFIPSPTSSHGPLSELKVVSMKILSQQLSLRLCVRVSQPGPEIPRPCLFISSSIYRRGPICHLTPSYTAQETKHHDEGLCNWKTVQNAHFHSINIRITADHYIDWYTIRCACIRHKQPTGRHSWRSRPRYKNLSTLTSTTESPSLLSSFSCKNSKSLS
jgi:hypothetical protein